MQRGERVVVYFDTVDGTSTYGLNPPKKYKTYYMIPANRMDLLSEEEEAAIVEFNNAVSAAESKKKTIYFDHFGHSYKRIILNPVIQKNIDNTCVLRTKKVLEWMNKHRDELLKLIESKMKEITVTGLESDIYGKDQVWAAGVVSHLEESIDRKNKFDDERKEQIQKLKAMQTINTDINQDNAKEQIQTL